MHAAYELMPLELHPHAQVTNPSDDYIWQILFAGENDVVPKRVTGGCCALLLCSCLPAPSSPLLLPGACRPAPPLLLEQFAPAGGLWMA